MRARFKCELEFFTSVSSHVLLKALEASPSSESRLLLLELSPRRFGIARGALFRLVCEHPGKFVLPCPLWTRANEYSILLSDGLGEEEGYRATWLFVSSSTET